jgi:hypothetical protein
LGERKKIKEKEDKKNRTDNEQAGFSIGEVNAWVPKREVPKMRQFPIFSFSLIRPETNYLLTEAKIETST